ncbi:MAG: structural protein P5 [Bacteroidaceae bacterium]|nr:structural protein P5 [Bacteroidaceae bacterium]
MKTNLSRGMRNNNPLNIRHSASQWQGMRAEQTDRAFVQFTSMVMGYRAAWRTLETYYKRFEAERKPFTPRNIIYRWAPPVENDSEAYLRRICHLTTLAGNAPLSRPSKILTIDDREKLVSLLAAMTCVENGIKMEAVNKQDIRNALRLAFK